MHNHERLVVWRRALDVSVEICNIAARYRGRRHAALLNQITRAVASIPANIAEGAGQSTDAQFARFLDVALGSLQELQSHLHLAAGVGLFPEPQVERWRNELVAIRRMLNGLARHMRNDPREPGN